jgi:CRISPR/Cas system-associated exonuclease Cas4 (RecB family)
VIELPSPHPAPISSLSPTAANDLLACPYRLAFRLDPQFRPLRRPSPSSSLGVVAHAVAEDVAKGLLAKAATTDDARLLVESTWSKHEASAHEHLTRRWAPASPPAPTEWPGYHLIRARTIRRAVKQKGPSRPTTPSPSIVETDLAATDAGLSGRPDRVEGGREDRCVVDLKTGLSQQGANESQRVQLLIYCYLVADATGDMPRRIAIEDPSGRRWEEEVDRDDVDKLVATVQDARRKYQDTPLDRLAALATPSADTCRHCAYRLVCTPYWQSLETAWEHGSVAGEVVEIRSNPHAAVALIDAASPVDATGSGWLVTSVPPAMGFALGAATVVDAELTGVPRHLRWRWSTLSWTPGVESA